MDVTLGEIMTAVPQIGAVALLVKVLLGRDEADRKERKERDEADRAERAARLETDKAQVAVIAALTEVVRHVGNKVGVRE
ncbi:MAG: hypothetical protein M3Q08_03620 [Pseudomonadota bacterium]|nr:hypothetical protein [Pseudomonadota bacterium]